MSSKKVFGGILLALGIVAIALISFASLTGAGVIDNKKRIVSCNVVVDEKLIGTELRIESAVCTKTSQSCGLPFSLFFPGKIVEGKVQLFDGSEKLDSQDFDNDRFTGKATVALDGCTESEELRVLLFRDEGVGFDDAVDSKIVKVV